jgi:hypothetical protein
MCSRRPERDARRASCATIVTPPKVQERAIRGKRLTRKKLKEQAPSDGTSDDGGGYTSEAEIPQKIHPSLRPDAPEPIEPQLLFLRTAAYIQYAILVKERIV